MNRVLNWARNAVQVNTLPVSGGQGALVRGFINNAIQGGASFLNTWGAFKRIYDSFDITYSDFADQFYRQTLERDFNQRTQNLDRNTPPDETTILESQFRVNKNYRYRVKVYESDGEGNIVNERYISVYSDILKNKSEIEDFASQNIEEVSLQSDPNFDPSSINSFAFETQLIEHNWGADY